MGEFQTMDVMSSIAFGIVGVMSIILIITLMIREEIPKLIGILLCVAVIVIVTPIIKPYNNITKEDIKNVISEIKDKKIIKWTEYNEDIQQNMGVEFNFEYNSNTNRLTVESVRAVVGVEYKEKCELDTLTGNIDGDKGIVRDVLSKYKDTIRNKTAFEFFNINLIDLYKWTKEDKIVCMDIRDSIFCCNNSECMWLDKNKKIKRFSVSKGDDKIRSYEIKNIIFK